MRFVQVIVVIMSCALAGCVAKQITVGSDYESYSDDDAARELRRSDLKIVEVYNARGWRPSNHVGEGQTGDQDERVGVVIDRSVAAYVKGALRVLVGEPDGAFTPVVVWVDTLTASEANTTSVVTIWVAESKASLGDEPGASCSMRFGFPAEDGTIHVMRSRSIAYATPGPSPTNADLTERLDDALRNALMKCTKNFLASSFDLTDRALYAEGDNLEEVTADLLEAGQSENSSYVEEETPQRRLGYIALLPGYFWSDKVTQGYSLGLELGDPWSEGRVYWSGGITIAVSEAVNDDKGINGAVFQFGFPFAWRFFLKPKMKVPYLHLSIAFIGGSESFEGREEQEENEFYGLKAEQSIGIELIKHIQLEFGIYQSAAWGSELVPTDIGFRTALRWAP